METTYHGGPNTKQFMHHHQHLLFLFHIKILEPAACLDSSPGLSLFPQSTAFLGIFWAPLRSASLLIRRQNKMHITISSVSLSSQPFCNESGLKSPATTGRALRRITDRPTFARYDRRNESVSPFSAYIFLFPLLFPTLI